MSIGERVKALDLTLFDKIETQSSNADREDWLAIQRVVRQPLGYSYLEIGSHLGGSIQQHLVDPLCSRITSVDKRPQLSPDGDGEKRKILDYKNLNSTQRMLDNLKQVGPVDKLFCVEGDYADINSHSVPFEPSFCFIDGEHTMLAAISDFQACLKVCSQDAVLVFHDCQLIRNALSFAMVMLESKGIPHVSRKMREFNFIICLRGCPVAKDDWILSHSIDGRSWLTQAA